MSLLDDTFALIRRPETQIDTLIPDVMVREMARDATAVTDHPVEVGSAISDHAFMLPEEIEMVLGWSDSTGGYVGYSDEAYQMLLELQKERRPFELATGRRLYKDMLITGIQETRDDKTSNSLMVSVRMRRVIITQTQTTSASKSAQANPAKTGSTVDVGQQQLKSVGTSGFASPTARE